MSVIIIYSDVPHFLYHSSQPLEHGCHWILQSLVFDDLRQEEMHSLMIFFSGNAKICLPVEIYHLAIVPDC
jgi:hypothetical protein